MARGTVFNPVSKERIQRLDAAPHVLRLEVEVPTNMVPPPPHVHLHEAEHFEVVEGQVAVSIGGAERTLSAGETLTVEPGVAHTWHNAGQGVLRLVTEFRPAGRMQSFFETFCGLASEGHCDRRGQPAFLQIAASAAHWDSYLAGPPIALQRFMFAVLRPVAVLFGYRPTYPRFEGTLGLSGSADLWRSNSTPPG